MGIIQEKKAWNFGVIDIGKQYGNMDTDASFYPEGMTAEEIKADILKRRIELGNEYGFDGNKIFMADQIDKSGTYFEIDNDYVEANPNGCSDIRQDILIVTIKTPTVVIGHPTADYPVVMMRDVKKGVTAIGHCSSEMIDKRLPMMMADVMTNNYGTKEDDIYTYVSACASVGSYKYDSYPKWATDKKVWKNCIKEKEKAFYIDLRRAIAEQLVERKVLKYCMNHDDTITNPDYYSNSAAFNGDVEKAGRNFAGAYYKKR